MCMITLASFWKEQAIVTRSWRSMSVGQHLLGAEPLYIAHSPSPRMTSKGTERFQSMK